MKDHLESLNTVIATWNINVLYIGIAIQTQTKTMSAPISVAAINMMLFKLPERRRFTKPTKRLIKRDYLYAETLMWINVCKF